MDKKFCTTCNAERDIVERTKKDNRVENLLSCGHKFIELSLHDTVKVHELFGLRKMGKVNVKYRRGDKPPNINYAKKFVEYGDIDYEAALVLFNIQDREYDFMNQAAFLCAQATEKYLKAFLFWNAPQHYPGLSGKQILNKFKELSHDLVKILNECLKDNKDFNNFKEKIKSINKYSLLKYPDVEDELIYSNEGLTISSEILKDVRAIGDFVKRLIGKK